jgi:hypothetical protein
VKFSGELFTDVVIFDCPGRLSGRTSKNKLYVKCEAFPQANKRNVIEQCRGVSEDIM